MPLNDCDLSLCVEHLTPLPIFVIPLRPHEHLAMQVTLLVLRYQLNVYVVLELP